MPPHTTSRLSSQFSGSASFSDYAWEEVGRTLDLSGRELQVVQGMISDKIQFAIAADLGISTHTVHTHIERLYHKLGVSNRAQLLVRVMTEFVILAAAAKIPPPIRPTLSASTKILSVTLPTVSAQQTADRPVAL